MTCSRYHVILAKTYVQKPKFMIELCGVNAIGIT